jgi:hypothetical protein
MLSSITGIFTDPSFPGHQVVQPPTINSLAEISKDLNIDLNDSELKEYQGVCKKHNMLSWKKNVECESEDRQ